MLTRICLSAHTIFGGSLITPLVKIKVHELDYALFLARWGLNPYLNFSFFSSRWPAKL